MASNPISLHHLTISEASFHQLAETAAGLSVPYVTLFVQDSERGAKYPLVKSVKHARTIKTMMSSVGISVHNVEVFTIRGDSEVSGYQQALDIGAELGAQRLTSSIVDPDLIRAGEKFNQLCEMAAERNLSVHLEFHAFGSINTLDGARRFLGANRPANAAIAADILHFMRNEGGIESLTRASDIPVEYAQICDGKLTRNREIWLDEAINDRMLPGLGEFDLVSYCRALPTDIVIDIEAPCNPIVKAEMNYAERARVAVTSLRRILFDAGRSDAYPPRPSQSTRYAHR